MTKYGSLLRAALVAGVAGAALAGCGMMSKSNVASFSGAMNAASEVPPNMTRGSGMAEAWLDRDTNVLKYKITYTGLSGPATMAHFHGPAPVGQNAGVMIPIDMKDVPSPIDGHATLSATQEAGLLAGNWYFNVHTAKNPGGEIRGQVAADKQ